MKGHDITDRVRTKNRAMDLCCDLGNLTPKVLKVLMVPTTILETHCVDISR